MGLGLESCPDKVVHNALWPLSGLPSLLLTLKGTKNFRDKFKEKKIYCIELFNDTAVIVRIEESE